MNLTYIFLTVFLFVMIGIYFLPYRKLRGKIFKKLLYFDPRTAKYIRFKSSSFFVGAERGDDNIWRTVTPSAWVADNVAIMKLIMRLTDLEVIERITDGANDSKFGLGKHEEISIVFNNKQIVVTIGIDVYNAEEIYLNLSTDKDILTVSNSIKNYFPKTIADFQKMSLFNTKYSDVKSIEAVFDGNTFMLYRESNGWLLKGKLMLDDTVRPLIESVLSTKADGFLTTKTKLPPKPEGFVIFKLLKDSTITRYFFNDINNEGQYLVPVEGTILYIKKDIMKTLFQN